MQLSQLTPGQKVMYADHIRASVIGTRKNGVLIGFWGLGLQAEKWVTRRVSATALSEVK